MMNQTEFVLPSASLIVTHESTTGDPGRFGDGIVIIDEDVHPDTITTIRVRCKCATQIIYWSWRPESWYFPLSILFVEETETLFVGGGTLSAIVDVRTMRVIRKHKSLLFWSFQHTRNSVIELGEVECFLFRRDGELVGSADVDPPYEVIEHDSDVEFLSSIFGSQRITYPT